MLAPTPSLGRGIPPFLSVLVPALLLTVLVGGRPPEPATGSGPAVRPAPGESPAGMSDPAPRGKEGCLADISHPLRLVVTLEEPVRPGRPVRARVEVGSRIPLDAAVVRLTPPADVRLHGSPAMNLGLVRAGETRTLDVTLTAPPGPARRTVDVVLEATSDGVPVSRGAILNLVFEQEPHRIVTTPDGRRIREVPARRIG